MSGSSSVTFRDRVAHYLTERPGQWVDGLTLEQIGGRYAWRSRVSDCRLQLGMTIENRQRKVNGVTKSEYRFVPAVREPPQLTLHEATNGRDEEFCAR